MLAPNENVTTFVIIFSASKYILMPLKLSTKLRNLVSKQALDHTHLRLSIEKNNAVSYCFYMT
ncbi:hypothetical protein, partial [Vibrio navarrensis]|uniref:hypothetical protein n=1 Tax=Vibrio navarrensis TaxID=29495 RepID=UPI001D042710